MTSNTHPAFHPPTAPGLASVSTTTSLVLPCSEDLVARDHLRRAVLQRPSLPGVADVVAAQIVAGGVRVDFAVAASARPLVAVHLGINPVAIVADAARVWAQVHDAGLALISLPTASAVSDAVWVDAVGQVTLVGWSVGPATTDVRGFADWALQILPPESLDGEAAAVLMRAADEVDASVTMNDISVAMAKAHRRPRVVDAPMSASAYSPPAQRRAALATSPVSPVLPSQQRSLPETSGGKHRRGSTRKETDRVPQAGVEGPVARRAGWVRIGVPVGAAVMVTLLLSNAWPFAAAEQPAPMCPAPLSSLD